jgi:hypothetical protein
MTGHEGLNRLLAVYRAVGQVIAAVWPVLRRVIAAIKR